MKDVSKMIGDVLFNYRVGVWIEKEGKVYLEVNPNIDFTTIPGGRVKTMEDSKEGIIREMQEEMHITLSEDELKLKTILENFFVYEEREYHELFILYKIDMDKEDNRFQEKAKNYDSEYSYYHWVEKEKLDEANLLPDVLRKISEGDKIDHIILNKAKGKRIYE